MESADELELITSTKKTRESAVKLGFKPPASKKTKKEYAILRELKYQEASRLIIQEKKLFVFRNLEFLINEYVGYGFGGVYNVVCKYCAKDPLKMTIADVKLSNRWNVFFLAQCPKIWAMLGISSSNEYKASKIGPPEWLITGMNFE